MGTKSWLGTKLETEIALANDYAPASGVSASSGKDLYRQVSISWSAIFDQNDFPNEYRWLLGA